MAQSNPGIDLTAAEWAIRLNERALSAEEQAEFDRWLAADTGHRGALLRARAVWADLDRLAAMRGRGETPSARGESSAEPCSSSGRSSNGDVATTNSEDGSSHGGFRIRRRLVAAAVATLFLGSGAAWLIEGRDKTYVSRLGQIRRVTLSDGSHMVLNTASEATVRFDKNRREIRLASGEGLFQVAKDPARPFVVRAGFVSVRAVGTVFSVRTVDQRVDVTVTEGVVELTDDSAAGGRVIRRVAANELATIMETREVQVQSIRHDEAERRLAWRDGIVDFAGEPLIDAVAEINRHNRRHIVVDDPALASRPVVGVFRTNDSNGFATTVATALGAQSVELEDAIHLRLAAVP